MEGEVITTFDKLKNNKNLLQQLIIYHEQKAIKAMVADFPI